MWFSVLTACKKYGEKPSFTGPKVVVETPTAAGTLCEEEQILIWFQNCIEIKCAETRILLNVIN